MAQGTLSEDEKKTLEAMIGSGPKRLALLYNIENDGCDPAVFHGKCDNKGPTVTVLYNQQGSAFGGYTSANWTSDASGAHAVDAKAFLFQLRKSGQRVVRRFPVNATNAANAIYCHSTYGPTFGYNYNLKTFEGAITKSENVYPLNGSITVNNDYYDHQGVSANDVNDGSMNVTELEVYSVMDGMVDEIPEKPWRVTGDLNEELLAELKDTIIKMRPQPGLDIPEYRILLIGPVGSGKSSFCNTVSSVFAGRISQRAICGNSEKDSITTAYTPYDICLSDDDTPLNFRLCDTRGLEDRQGLDITECSYLVNGHIPEYYEFNPSGSVGLDSPEFVHKPSPADKAHCALFVIDASTVDTLPEEVMTKLIKFRRIINQKRIPQAVLLTKIDMISKRAKSSLSTVFSNCEIKDRVKSVSKLLGIPPNYILPVKNFVTEIQLDDTVSALALLALRQVLTFAEDHLKNLRMKHASSMRMSTMPTTKLRTNQFKLSAPSDEYYEEA